MSGRQRPPPPSSHGVPSRWAGRTSSPLSPATARARRRPTHARHSGCPPTRQTAVTDLLQHDLSGNPPGQKAAAGSAEASLRLARPAEPGCRAACLSYAQATPARPWWRSCRRSCHSGPPSCRSLGALPDSCPGESASELPERCRRPAAPLAGRGCDPRHEILIAPPPEQEGLGAERLGVLDLAPLFAVLSPNLEEPAAVPEALLTGRVLRDSVLRDVLADHDLSHFGSPFIGVVGYRHRRLRLSASARIVRAVGDGYTAAPGNWAPASRPVRPPGGVHTGWKRDRVREEGDACGTGGIWPDPPGAVRGRRC